jgi:5'-nucleotidase
MPNLTRVVGRTTVSLEARSAEGRTRETNVGNLITDAFRKATRADIALINGGSIRADTLIRPGVLTFRDVLSILPFNNKIVKLELTGATLREALEHGLSRSSEDAEPGRFPQISGIALTFDGRRPAGSRLVDVRINGKPLIASKKYTLATTDFLFVNGGDGYTMLKNATVLIAPERGELDSEVLRRTITAARSIAPRVEGRIKRLDQRQKDRQDCQ